MNDIFVSKDDMVEVFKNLNYYYDLCVNYNQFKQFKNEYEKIHTYINKWKNTFDNLGNFSGIDQKEILIVKEILQNIKFNILDMEANEGYFYHDDLYTWIDILNNYITLNCKK